MKEHINIGLPREYADEMSAHLNKLLANFSTFYQSLRALHWNIKGKQFLALHVKFEELYNEAAEIVDEIAERILVLENQPLHTMQDFVKASTLPAAQNIDDPLEAVTFAIQNIRTLIDQERTLVSVAEAYNDHGTIALLSEYVISQEKQVWMLSASL